MSKKVMVVAFASGLVFAIGLGVSGMTQPSKVIAFLDLFGGSWDPSLALVMAGAVAVHAPFYRWIRARADAPLTQMTMGSCGPIDDEQTETGALGGINGKIIAGAAIFGVGWGLGGYCPGPAVVSAISGVSGTLIFVASMLVGMLIFQFLFESASNMRSKLSDADLSQPSALTDTPVSNL
jgi:uncharacterized protein